MLIKRPILATLLSCLVVTLTVFGTSTLSSQQKTLRVMESETSFNDRGLRVYRDALFTGEMLSYYAPGVIAANNEFVDGRRHGYARKWFANGQKSYESFYVNGAREGVTKSWWANGNLRSNFIYVDGKADGIANSWYRSGAKFKQFNYSAGIPVGLQQAWRKNGKLFSNFEYKNGRIYGLRKANNCVGLEDEVISPDYYQTQASLTL